MRRRRGRVLVGQLRLWSEEEHELLFLDALCLWINKTPDARAYLRANS